MFTQKSVIGYLKKITGEIKNTGLHLRKVVLYGSYATNKQHKWSDIDVAFIADEFNGIGFEDTQLFSGIMIKYPKLNIQPRTYNTEDFTPDKDPFVEEILRTGIEIKA
jgi:predicted nucleotidyltransferase